MKTLLQGVWHRPARPVAALPQAQVVLSFDVEEHYRIESARGIALCDSQKAVYAGRVGPSIDWLLGRLAEYDIRATFFILGQLASEQPQLVRTIHRHGHEVASHGWDHRRLHQLTPASFREDLRQSCAVLADLTGEPVLGYRAPTFSLVKQTAWAIDVLAEFGLLYDSSIYPVRHDRYGVPAAPRTPFRLRGLGGEILELPPATLRLFRTNLAAGGGGYFRLFPLTLLEQALAQVQRKCEPPVAMLYFHPWEFDEDQPRLPLTGLNRFRTYVGLRRTRRRFARLLHRHRFTRACDVARQLQGYLPALPVFDLPGPRLPC